MLRFRTIENQPKRCIVRSHSDSTIVTETSLHLFEEQLDLLMCVSCFNFEWTKEIIFTVILNNIE